MPQPCPVPAPPAPSPATRQVTTLVDTHPVALSHTFASPHHGAELCFLGVVRGSEDGQPIRGIRYSAYLPMARATLQTLADAVAAGHPQALIHIHHTLGEVEAGQPSVLIAVATPHSAEAFAVSQELLRRLKTEVPIWKEPMPSPQPPNPEESPE